MDDPNENKVIEQSVFLEVFGWLDCGLFLSEGFNVDHCVIDRTD